MYLYQIFIILLITSSLHAQDSVTTAIRILSDDPITIQKTIAEIEYRLTNTGYDTHITEDDSISVFLISTSIESGSKADSILYYSQLESNELEFGIALRQDDQIIRLLYRDLVAVDGLSMQDANNPAAIFLSRDPQLLDEQLDNLNQRIKTLSNPKYRDLAFCWSKQPVRITNDTGTYMAYILYAYNSASDYGIDESNIHTVEINRVTRGEEIQYTFKPQAHHNWLDLTYQAAKDNARAILMMLNNEVINAPRIASGIDSGKGFISGIQNRGLALVIARQIRIGRLPAEVEILSTIKLNPTDDTKNTSQ